MVKIMFRNGMQWTLHPVQVAPCGVKIIGSQSIDQGRPLQQVNTGTKHVQKANDNGNEHGINRHILSSPVRFPVG